MKNISDKKKAELMLKRLENFYGDVNPDLRFGNLYEITVAVVLSAQTTDKQVNAVTPALFAKYPNFASLAEARPADVEKLIQSTGFFHTKAKNIIALSKMITEDFDGQAPRTMDELVRLPGVGRKSANVILSLGHNLPGLAVDTHVGRIANRLGFTSSKDPSKIEKALTSLLPPENWKKAHLLLIAHGRRTCTARNPRCLECPIGGLCDYVMS